MIGATIDNSALQSYLKSLVNRFFKILPMREQGEKGLTSYMDSLLLEMLGCRELGAQLKDEPSYGALLGTLTYLSQHPEAEQRVFKREVFKSISLLNLLTAKIAGAEGGGKK